ncbi:MAG: hypothetical protein ACKOU6_12320 [Planctomycetota bacterium]
MNEGPTTLLARKVEWNRGRSRCELGRKSLGLTGPKRRFVAYYERLAVYE